MALETSVESILDVLELIGETSKGFGDDIKSRYPTIPWRQILGMRNFLAHEYFIRESEIIWETLQLGLPELAAACRAELERLGAGSSNR